MIGASFDSTKTPLQELLARARTGHLQLPDFQRGWVWDDEHIKSLLASVSVSFPIGAVMLLQTGGEHIRFKPRPLAGTDEALHAIEPETFVLDGQQRLTSLYQALMSTSAVETKDAKGKPIRRWYYLDMRQAINPEADQEDAVLSVPEDRQAKAFGGHITLDVATPEREYAADLFPLNCIFGSATWRRLYNMYWNHDAEKSDLFDRFEGEVVERFKQYQVPVIELKKETPKEAVCLVFERVNTGGVSLTVFELLTASFATDDFQLRDDWDARETRLKQRHPVLHTLERAADIGPARMDEILASHCIAPDPVRADRFWDFYAARAEALLQRIEAATGKTITRELELFRTDVVPNTYDDGPQELVAEEPIEEALW